MSTLAAIRRRTALEALWHSRHLLIGLVVRQLRSNYAGTAGGGWWLLARPIIMVLAYYFVFDVVMAVRLRPGMVGTETYALYLVSALIPWLAWTDGVVQGSASLIHSADLLRKTRLPVELIPARSVLSSSAGFFPVTFLVAAVSVYTGGAGFTAFLWLPFWLTLQLLMAYYLALVLAILAAALRDIGNLVQTLFGMMIFFSPILFPIERVPEFMRPLLWLNPFTVLANGYHAILLQGELPAWQDLAGVAIWLSLLTLFASLLLRRAREQLVDWL